MNSKIISAGVGIALVLGIVGLFVGDTTNPIVERTVERVGAAAGPDFFNHVYAHQGITFGEGCFSTTTSGTLLAATLGQNSCLRLLATTTGMAQPAVSWTLPASTTMSDLIPKAGNCQEWFIDSSGVVAATTTTILKGTGIDLVGLDATGAGTGADVIDGLEFGQLTLCREANTDIVGYVTEWIHAD